MQNDSTSAARKYNSISPAANAAFNIVFFICMLLCILPIILVFMISITDEHTIITNGYTFFPKKIDFQAYVYLLKDPTLVIRAYLVTIFVTVVGTVLNSIISSLFAYPISRRDFPFRKFFTYFIFITMVFSGGLVPQYIVYTSMFHLQDKLAVLIIPGLFSAFFVIIIRTFISTNIPESLIESAKIDGASEMLIYWRIILPLSLPVMASVALFTALFYWNDWFDCLMYIQQKEKLYNLQFVMMRALLAIEYLKNKVSGLAQINTAKTLLPSESVRMAMAIIGIGPIVLVYPFLQKYFVKGLTIGAVKG